MADTEGHNRIVDGTGSIVGVECVQTGILTDDPGVGHAIFAAQVVPRVNSAPVDDINRMPTSDTAAQGILATIAGQTIALATAALQGTANTTLNAILSATGTDANGVVQPTGGTGQRGWLSGIYSKLITGLTITGTVTTADSGTPATGVAPATGATGIIGWLSMVYSALTSGISFKTAQYTPIALDLAVVVTAGTAINVLSAGHATAGGFIHTTNAAGMFVSQIGAAGTTDGGNTIFVPAGKTYRIIPSAGAVSVNSLASGTAIAGYGAN
jgi:hypothetical protein